EERAGAEEVEVRGVDVIGRQIGLARGACARPAIFEAPDSAVVEAHGTPRSLAPVQQAVVSDGDDAEDDDWNGQPPSCEEVPGKAEPGHHGKGQPEGEAQVRHLSVTSGEGLESGLPLR